jgi:hypothetical protein
MTYKKFLIAYKIFFALLGLYAIAQETIVLIARGTYNFVNFWSFFTNQSNLFADVMLLVGAYALWRGISSPKLDLIRGASSLYMIITGVVFALLLAGEPNLVAVPIDNTILHETIPVAMLLDWLLNSPAKRLGFKKGLLWIIYPLFYAACALVRGALTNWYPYPFLNPGPDHNYGPVAVTIVEISAFVILMAWLMTRLPLGKAKAVKKTSRRKK